MIWLRWSVGKIAIWLPHRLHERDRADVAVGVDTFNHIDLVEQRIANLLGLALLRYHDVVAPLLGAHILESRLGRGEPGAVGDEQQRAAAPYHHPGANRADQPRILDLRDEALEVRHRDLHAGSRGLLLLSWE